MTATREAGETFPDVVRTSGRSMAPLIRDGSIVALLAVSPEKVIPGEIIVFRREGKLFAHRLIEVRGQGSGIELREKGDNVRRATWIPGSSLVGKAVEIRQGYRRRALNVDLGQRRVRWLTNGARREADLVENYVAAKAEGRLFGRFKGVLLPAAILVAPFRFIVLRLLLTVYPHQEAVEDMQALRHGVELFRSLFPVVDPGVEDAMDIQDWSSVAEAAAAQGIVPLLARARPDGRQTAFVPPRVLDRVRRHSYRIALNHTLAMAALRAVTRALAGADIPYAVLKGPFLYEALYLDVFPREYEDVDILVSRRDVPRAVTALRSAGYAVEGGHLSQAVLRLGHFHLALAAPTPGWPPIELHWHLVDRGNLYRLPDDECLARRRLFRTAEDTFSVLAAEDEFIYLCLHATKHGVLNSFGVRRGCPPEWFCRSSTGNRLLWFLDIALFLRQNMEHLDWEAVRHRLSTWNVTEEVRDCLFVLDRLAPGSPARAALGKLSVGAEFPAPSVPIPPRPDGAHARDPLPGSATDRMLDWAMRMNPTLLIRPIRILLLGRILFPSPDHLLAYHNARSRWQLPWLYVRHPFHMIGKLLGMPT